MVWFVFVIALFNIWFGYFLAAQFFLPAEVIGSTAPMSIDKCQTPHERGAQQISDSRRSRQDVTDDGLAVTASSPDGARILNAWRDVSRKLNTSLGHLGQRLRAVADADDLAAASSLGTDLTQTCRALLNEIREIEQQSAILPGEAREKIEETCMELSAQLETTLSNLQQQDLQENGTVSPRRLFTEIDALSGATERLLARIDSVITDNPTGTEDLAG